MKVNFIVAVFAGILISASSAIAQVNLYKAEFNTNGEFEGWTDNGSKMEVFLYDGTTNTGEEEVNGGASRAKVAGGANSDAQMVEGGLSINGDLAKDLVVRIRQTQNNGATWDTAGVISGILSVIYYITGNTVFSGSTEVTQTANETVNPLFPALRSGPTAVPGASR